MKKYEIPEIDVVVIEVEDVMTASFLGDEHTLGLYE